jgi:hypothetical protein
MEHPGLAFDADHAKPPSGATTRSDRDVLREVIELTTDRTWRRKLPDKGRAVSLGLVERMCAATKSRFADEILAIAQLEPALGPVRTELAMASTEQLAGCSATSDDIGVRALASWFLAGTARYPMDGILRRQGDLAAVWEAARELGVPADWLNLLDRSARRMHWPLAHVHSLNPIELRNNTTDSRAVPIVVPASTRHDGGGVEVSDRRYDTFRRGMEQGNAARIRRIQSADDDNRIDKTIECRKTISLEAIV